MEPQSKKANAGSLMSRLDGGEVVLCAEGYLFAFERQGYLTAGSFVPEVVIEHPNLVRQAHVDFVRAGSDVVQAFTYYAHREKMRLIGRENELEEINRAALRIAKEVATSTGTLMAGNICNTNLYDPAKPEFIEKTKLIFEEQVKWAVDEGADYIVAETFAMQAEALLALETIKAHNMPAVVTLSSIVDDGTTSDPGENIPLEQALRKLEEHGADVVGLNCTRGPDTMLPVMQKVRHSCRGHLAALPVPYRTTPECKSMFKLRDVKTQTQLSFPADLDEHLMSRREVAEFASRARAMDFNYLGLCCGNSPGHMRSLAESLGRRPEASKYSPDMEKHCILGKDTSLQAVNTLQLRQLVYGDDRKEE